MTMHIGMTYDLRDEYLAEGYGEEATAEFDRVETIDAIAAGLRELGHQVDRIGRARQLVQRLAAGDRWDLVFNICEGLKGMARESQVPAILEVFDIPYTFGDPLGHVAVPAQRAGEDGGGACRTADAQVAGRRIAGRPRRLALSFPLFAKPVAEGTGKGITPASRITTATELGERLRATAGPVPPAGTGRGVLAGPRVHGRVAGHRAPRPRVLGTLEIVLLSNAEPGVYSYVNKEKCEELVEYRLVGPDDAEVRMAEQIGAGRLAGVGGP